MRNKKRMKIEGPADGHGEVEQRNAVTPDGDLHTHGAFSRGWLWPYFSHDLYAFAGGHHPPLHPHPHPKKLGIYSWGARIWDRDPFPTHSANNTPIIAMPNPSTIHYTPTKCQQ